MVVCHLVPRIAIGGRQRGQQQGGAAHFSFQYADVARLLQVAATEIFENDRQSGSPGVDSS